MNCKQKTTSPRIYISDEEISEPEMDFFFWRGVGGVSVNVTVFKTENVRTFNDSFIHYNKYKDEINYILLI